MHLNSLEIHSDSQALLQFYFLAHVCSYLHDLDLDLKVEDLGLARWGLGLGFGG